MTAIAQDCLNFKRWCRYIHILEDFFARLLHLLCFSEALPAFSFSVIKSGKSDRHPNRTDVLPGASAGALASCERPARTSAAGWPSRPTAAGPPLAARPPTTHNSAAESAIRRPTMSAAQRPARTATQAATPSWVSCAVRARVGKRRRRGRRCRPPGRNSRPPGRKGSGPPHDRVARCRCCPIKFSPPCHNKKQYVE